VFGALVISDASLVFQYLFAVCNSLQGVCVFIFNVALDRKYVC
jgi:hypothetical protein